MRPQNWAAHVFYVFLGLFYYLLIDVKAFNPMIIPID